MKIPVSLGLLLALGMTVFGTPIAEPPADPARDKAIAWITANNAFGPEAPVVKDMTKAIDDGLKDGYDLFITFGPKMVKADKVTTACHFAGQFFVFEFPDDQAKQIDVNKRNIKVRKSARQDKSGTPLAQLSDLTIDRADNLAGDKPITGQVKIRGLQEIKEPMELRFSYRANGKNKSAFYHLDQPFGEKAKTVTFTYFPVNDKQDKVKLDGPLIVFVDLCEVKGKKGEQEVTLKSNSLGTVVEVENGK